MSSSLPPRVDVCRSCSAEIVWLRIRPGGRRMPVDLEPSPAGNILADLSAAGGVVLSAAALRVVKEETPDEPLYVSHFATCPQAGEWRRKRG